MKRQNYLNNKDMLKEIHKSKSNFSSFIRPEYHQYDIILEDISKINIQTIAQAKKNKAKRLQQLDFDERKAAGEKVKLADCAINYQKITKEELIFRIMTYDHIPDEPLRKKNPKSVADTKVKLNFPPFQHFKFNESGELICVGKSHWIGDMETGHFSKNHAQATETLARMWMKLCERYGTRGNVRGYTYNDEMQGQAIEQLAKVGLQFDESKSDNPFSYYTATVTNSFVRVINIEKKNQNLRDDILEMNDMNPSYTRQHNNDWEAGVKRNLDSD